MKRHWIFTSGPPPGTHRHPLDSYSTSSFPCANWLSFLCLQPQHQQVPRHLNQKTSAHFLLLPSTPTSHLPSEFCKMVSNSVSIFMPDAIVLGQLTLGPPTGLPEASLSLAIPPRHSSLLSSQNVPPSLTCMHTHTELAAMNSNSNLSPLPFACIPSDGSHLPATVNSFLTSTPLSGLPLRLECLPLLSSP